MSGHVSEITACGLKYPTVYALHEKTGVAFEDVFAVFHFAFTKGSVKVTSDRMHLSAIAGGCNADATGWSERNGQRRLETAVNHLYPWSVLKLSYNQDIVYHENNRCARAHWPDNVRLAIDTVTVVTQHRTSRGEEDYSGKYQQYVWKLLVGCSLSGFVVFVSPSLYSGRTSDNVIYDHCGVDTLLKAHGHVALADGGFEGRDHLLTPFPGNIVWPTQQWGGKDNDKAPVREPTQPEWAKYCEDGETKLRYNALIAHYRSRVEHIFARTGLGRFSCFTDWSHNPTLCYQLIVICLAALNVEIEMRHGLGGKYDTPSPAFPAGSMQMCRSRYPKPDQWRPKLRRKRERDPAQQTLDEFVIPLTQGGVTVDMDSD